MKKCVECNEELLVVFDTNWPEVCDTCFFKSFTQNNKNNKQEDTQERLAKKIMEEDRAILKELGNPSSKEE